MQFKTETGIPAFPRLIRRETGLMEFICEHGVGHPPRASWRFMDKVYGHKPGTWSVHGCDGCCRRDDFPDVEYHPARLDIVRPDLGGLTD